MKYEEFKEKFNIRLTPQQEAAVLCEDPSVLLLAVPGSGKTTVLVTRLGYMLYCRGIAPENILTMTYTVSAAGDMRRRFEKIFGDEFSDRLEFRTINGVCAMVIMHYSRLRGRNAFALSEANGKILSDTWRKVAEEIPSESDVKNLQTAITYAKNMMLSEGELNEVKIESRSAAPFIKEYNDRMKEKRLMDYDDQMVYALTILKKYPEILEHFRGKWGFLCVDEAQDTSKIQHEIIKLLYSKSIFMVGDEDQSIYGFRAAYPAALMAFESTYPGAKVLLMEENFRSSPEIVASADAFIRRNALRRDKRMVTKNPAGVPVMEMMLKSRFSQYYELAKLLREDGGDAAVLFRNNDSAIPLIDVFSRLNIPYRCRQNDSTFFSHYILRDVADFMYLAKNPYDADVFMGLYYKTNCRISREEAQAVCRYSEPRENGSLFMELAHKPGTSSRKGEKLMEMHLELYALRGDAPETAIGRIQYEMGYGAYLLSRGADMEKLCILRALASQEPDFDSLMSRLNSLKKLVEAGGGEEGPVFGTIHSAKGLEYEKVYLMDVVDGVLPCIDNPTALYITPDNARTLEEERRLFYVGATRAKRELILISYKGVASTFTKQFLGREVPLKAPTEKRFSPLSASAPARSTLRESDILPGMKLKHKVFGECAVLGVTKGCVRLKTADGAERILLLSACLSEGLLELI